MPARLAEVGLLTSWAATLALWVASCARPWQLLEAMRRQLGRALELGQPPHREQELQQLRVRDAATHAV